MQAPYAPALPAPATGPRVTAALAAVAGVAVGLVAALDPELLHFRLSALNVAALTAALAFGAALVWRPALALIVLLVVVYLGLSDVLVRWHGAPSLLQALALPLLLAAWRAERGARVSGSPPVALTLVLLAYVLVVWLSTTWARDAALSEARAIALVKTFALYALVFLLAGSRALLRRAAWTVVLAAALLAGLGVFQSLTGAYGQSFGGLARAEYAQIYGRVFEARIAGPLGDPNFFAQMLLPAIPLGLALALGASSAGRRLAAWGAIATITAAVILTYSRGAALALGVVLVAWLVLQGISRRRLAAGLAAAALLLVVLPTGFAQRLTTFRQFLPEHGDVLRLDSSFEQRRVLATTAWHMFLDRPLTGVGAGNYAVHHYPYMEETSSVVLDYDESDRTYPHNLYLEIAAETGLPGVLLFGAALLACFVYLGRARRRFRGAGDEPSALLATGVLVALVGYLVTSLFLHGHFARYLWLLFALCAALYRVAPVGREDALGPADARAAAPGVPSS